MIARPVLLVTALLCADLALAQPAANLLANPGFEDPAGWNHAWTIENLNNNGAPYVYHLTVIGGGHGKARPRTGDNHQRPSKITPWARPRWLPTHKSGG